MKPTHQYTPYTCVCTHEPTPAATLNSGRRRVELSLERLDRAKGLFQSLLQRSIRELSPILIHRGQVCPK